MGLSGVDKITAIKMKSESLQKRIEMESKRLLGEVFFNKKGESILNKTDENKDFDWLKASTRSAKSDKKVPKNASNQKTPPNQNIDQVVASTNKKLAMLLGNHQTSLPSNHDDVEMSVAELSLPGYKSPLPGVGELGNHQIENYLENLTREAKN